MVSYDVPFIKINKNSLFKLEENQCLADMLREIILFSIPNYYVFYKVSSFEVLIL